MFVHNLKIIFIFAIFPMISAEWTDDGKAMFFGLPISRITSNTNSDSPMHTLLKSAMIASDSVEEDDENPIDMITPQEMDLLGKSENDSVSIFPTEKDILKSSESTSENEFLGEDSDLVIPNLLLTEATASNAQRQPLNGVPLASFIRSAVAFARPLSQRLTASQKNLFTGSNRDPLKDMISLVEILVGRMGSTLAKTNPMDLLNLIDGMQTAVDRMGGDGECSNIFELMDQTMVTFKELMEMMNAVHKLGDMWNKVNISTLRNCITKPGSASKGLNQSKEKIDSVEDD